MIWTSESFDDLARRAATARPDPFGLYLHVPFCSSRCGYCDFNTYTATELGGGGSIEDYPGSVMGELDRARQVMGDRRVDTVFVGGGTPTLLAPGVLIGIIDRARELFGFTDDVEITTEANPESVDEDYLSQLRAGGFTRISLGMQSISERVLTVLERRHRPGRSIEMAKAARAAGFSHVSLDLIYGTPGESLDDWKRSVDAVLGAPIDHVSAYSLTIEPGTAMGRRLARGEIAPTDPDDLADKYEIADDAFGAAGLSWYEISNWAAPGGQCRHNLHYWRSGDWWGAGPGAHSHLAGLRWWNVKHPRRYAEQVGAGVLPVQDFEQVDPAGQAEERIMLELRLADGIACDGFDPALIDDLRLRGLVERDEQRMRLTRRGRLLGDAVVLELVQSQADSITR